MKVNFIKGPMLDGLRQQIYIDFANNKKTTFMSVRSQFKEKQLQSRDREEPTTPSEEVM